MAETKCFNMLEYVLNRSTHNKVSANSPFELVCLKCICMKDYFFFSFA